MATTRERPIGITAGRASAIAEPVAPNQVAAVKLWSLGAVGPALLRQVPARGDGASS